MEDRDRIRLILDASRRPFGVIAGRRMTKIVAQPIDDVMRKLEAVETKDWFPLGMEKDGTSDVNAPPWLAFAVALDDLQWWVDHFDVR